MAQVHTFPLTTNLFPDTRLPFQFPGNGGSPAAKQVELSVLLAWIETNMAVPSGVQTATITSGSSSAAVSSGKLVEKIVVIGTGAGTFNLGTTVGGSDILAGESYDTGGVVYVFDKYFNAAGALHFSGFTGTLTVKIYSR